MKKEKREGEKIPDLSLIPWSLLRDCSPLMFMTSPQTRLITLIPRHVVTHIQVYPIHTDIKMLTSRQQPRRPPANTGFQSGTRAITNPQIIDTDLHEAARSGNLSKAQEAVSAKRELLKRQNAQGNLPLHLAIQGGHKTVAMYLVGEYPQGSYELNAERLSPLYLAVQARQLELVDSMFQKLASDPNLISRLKQGKPIVHAAIINHHKEMLQVISKHQRELILMETHDDEGRTPLSCAAYHGFVDVVEYLLKRSPKLISARDKDKDRSYAVHKACLRGHIEVLKAFHAYRPESLLVRDRCGWTILHVAAKKPQDKLKDVVSYLVGLHEIGQKLLSIKDEDECSPLDLAVSCKNRQIIEILRQSKSMG